MTCVTDDIIVITITHQIIINIYTYRFFNTLHTVLYAFSKLLTKRIGLTVKNLFGWWSFP